ncbi:MAG: hypothetical protein BGO31_09295 [Bacteroidetes bacterium 43-16]|nr:MAG: hypothetical protein BGO31_09295 [Bacteroidetes bacterium 43-16]
MEQSNRGGGLLGILAVVGGALLVKKFAQRRNRMRSTLAEFGINERSPFALADQIRAMDQEKYDSLKDKLKQQFDRNRCCR